MPRKYSDLTLKKLFALSKNQCAHPECTFPVVQAGTEESDPGVIAQIAHIYASSTNGPRGKPSLSPKERDSYENLILLCPNHHSVVDKQHETYPASLLLEWKREHESNPADSAGSVMEMLSRLPVDLIDNEIQRSLATIRMSRFFVGFDMASSVRSLAIKMTSGEWSFGSNETKAKALAWCARLLVLNDRERAEAYLSMAEALGDVVEQKLAKAYFTAEDEGCEVAVELLAQIGTPQSKSCSFAIIANKMGADAALEWVVDSGLTIHDLDDDGKAGYVARLLEKSKWEELKSVVDLLAGEVVGKNPILLFCAAMANLLPTVPEQLRQEVAHQVPFIVKGFPLASDYEAASRRRVARHYFTSCSESARKMGLSEAADITADYALWLSLEDSQTRDAGLRRLESSVVQRRHMLRRMNFVVQYQLPFTQTKVEKEIDYELELTQGLSKDAKFARFCLLLCQPTPEAGLEYLDRFREDISSIINRSSLVRIEVESLVKIGRFNDARTRLKEFESMGGDERLVTELQQYLAGAADGRAEEALIDNLKNNPTLENLQKLLEYSYGKNWSDTAEYGGRLFVETRNLQDLEKWCEGLYNSGQRGQLLRVLHEQEGLRGQSHQLKSMYLWSLYSEGRLNECANDLQEVRRTRQDQNDAELAIQLAVASGQWEKLNDFVESEWDLREQKTAQELLRAATIAQQVGSTREQALVNAAVAKSAPDPSVFLNAYGVAVSGGWEDDDQVGQWLKSAIDLSDDEGPIQQFSLRDVLDRKPSWEKRESDTWEKLKSGELPMFAAAKLLNRSLFDMALLPALANANEVDVRRRSSIFAFSGSRRACSLSGGRLGLDPTSLLTLTQLDLLQCLPDLFDELVISHSTLRWLFEESRKVGHHQPSQFSKAKELRLLIDEELVRPFTANHKPDPDLSSLVGEELAALLAASVDSASNGATSFVVRSAPVHRIGSLMDEEVDLSSYKDQLCSCTAVVEKLKQKGQLSASEEEHARAYLSANEKRWPYEPAIPDGAVLYLDDLSVHYLQHVGVLERLGPAGLRVYVSHAEVAEMRGLLKYENLSSRAMEVIETIRLFLEAQIREGKVRIAPEVGAQHQDDAEVRAHPTFGSLNMAELVDVVAIDDRSLNRHENIGDTGAAKPITTAVDILDALRARGLISGTYYQECITKLRRMGYVFLPIDVAELESYVSRATVADGQLVESLELRAVRENFLQSRMVGALRLPHEGIWVANFMKTAIDVIKGLWLRTPDAAEVEAKAVWLLQFLDIRGWTHAYDHDDVDPVLNYAAQLMLLLTLPDGASPEVSERYKQWIDNILSAIKEDNYDVWNNIIRFARDLVLGAGKGANAGSSSSDAKIDPEVAVMLTLNLLPESVRQALFDDNEFQQQCGLSVSTSVRINPYGNTIDRRSLYRAVRSKLNAPADAVVVTDDEGVEWTLEIAQYDNGAVALVDDGKRVQLPDLWPLLPPDDRNRALEIRGYGGYPSDERDRWLKILSKNEVSDQDCDDLLEDLRLYPLAFEARARQIFSKGGSIEALVPKSQLYYERLIGRYGGQNDLQSYVEQVLQPFVDDLLAWDAYEGLWHALLLCSHSSIAALINLIDVDDAVTSKVFGELKECNNPIAQVGAVEAGARVASSRPELEASISRIVHTIKGEDAEHGNSRFNLIASLIILVDGELSRTRLLSDRPPYWRRLASLTHAALLARSIDGQDYSIAEFGQWVHHHRVQHFYIQNLVDMRLEPRWLPDFLTAKSLKSELLGRLIAVNAKYPELVPVPPPTRASGDDQEETSAQDFFAPFYPGPLEGGVEGGWELTAELEEFIQRSLSEAKLNAKSFSALVNATLLFKLEDKHADLAIRALRDARQYLQVGDEGEEFKAMLSGLAVLAASTRSPELAEEVRFLARRGRATRPEQMTMDFCTRLLLIAAASHYNLQEWRSFVGDSLTELAYECRQDDDIAILQFRVRHLCHLVPELWKNLARADAALEAAAR